MKANCAGNRVCTSCDIVVLGTYTFTHLRELCQCSVVFVMEIRSFHSIIASLFFIKTVSQVNVTLRLGGTASVCLYHRISKVGIIVLYFSCTIHSKINVTPKGVYLPISKLHSILAVANLLAHNNKSQICYCGQISLQSAAVNCSFSDTFGGNIYFNMRFKDLRRFKVRF